jgi:hypothetical protein
MARPGGLCVVHGAVSHGVETYQTMKRELEQAVVFPQGAFSGHGWSSLLYQCWHWEFDELVPLSGACDLALIAPLRDGMNLVAKEFMACRPEQTAALVLSELAGAAQEMREALLINPYHEDEIADAVYRALTKPVGEQVPRNGVLQDRLRRYDVHRWACGFLRALESAQQTAARQRARILGVLATLGRLLVRLARALEEGSQQLAARSKSLWDDMLVSAWAGAASRQQDCDRRQPFRPDQLGWLLGPGPLRGRRHGSVHPDAGHRSRRAGPGDDFLDASHRHELGVAGAPEPDRRCLGQRAQWRDQPRHRPSHAAGEVLPLGQTLNPQAACPNRNTNQNTTNSKRT